MSQEPSYTAMLSFRLPSGSAAQAQTRNGALPGAEMRARLEEALQIPLPAGERGEALAESLQEEVLEILRRRLDEAGIALDQRIVLTLDGAGNIHAGEHPARARLEELARREPLPGLFRQIAAVALAGRGLEDLRLARGLLEGGAGDEPMLQACLKGALSHFHLVKNQG